MSFVVGVVGGLAGLVALAGLPPDPFPVAGPHQLFVNFGGVTLSYALPSNSQANTTNLENCVGTYASVTDQPAIAATMQSIRQMWEPYGVAVTDVRPASGNYTMVVVSPSFSCAGGAAGIAPIQCGATNLNAVAFAGGPYGKVIAQEAAHTVGLAHVGHAIDIMAQGGSLDGRSFVDQCLPLTGTSYCQDMIAVDCPSGGQNSHRFLTSLFGEASPDSEGPTVQIDTPDQGAQVPDDAALSVTVSAADPSGIMEVALLVDDASVGTRANSPYVFEVGLLSAGSHVLVAEATDQAGNVGASPPVMIQAGGMMTTSSSAPTGGGASASEGASVDPTGGGSDPSGSVTASSTSGSTSGAGLGPLGSATDGEGCACRVGRVPEGLVTDCGFAVLALALGWRRRTATG